MKRRVIRTGVFGLLLGGLLAAIVLIVPGREAARADRIPVPAPEMQPSIQLTAPVGGEDLRAGSTYDLRWSHRQCSGTLRLQLWDGVRAEWTTIATGIPATDGEYRWPVPENLVGHRFRVRATLEGSPGTYWLSSDYFTVEAPERTADQGATTATERPPGEPTPAGLEVRCFPSVSGDRIRCAWTGGTPTGLSVWSVTGALVASYTPAEGASTFRLSVGSWPSGVYTVAAAFADGRSAIGRFVVRR